MEDASVATCLELLLHFRVKELKDVLSQLELPKQGKKQDLVERIKTALSNEQAFKTSAKKHTLRKEEIVRLIDDTYRKMQGTSASDLAAVGDCVSDNNSLQNSGNAADQLKSEKKIRCICETSLSTESVIKCDDKKCGIWQHLGCVLLPDETGTSAPDPLEKFYCEICRLTKADPFLQSLAHLLNPVKLVVKNVPDDGTNPLLHLEKSFHLARADKDKLSKQEYDLQAWCMLVNDKIIYRMQWPQHAVLRVNGMPVRATNRPGSQVLGSNGRDDGVIITHYTSFGSNKISLEASDTRTFCLGVRLVKRRSLQQIRNLIPKESDGESIEEALARLQRCIGGGALAEESESDSELLVIAESHAINLRCPMSGSRIKVAGRFRPCVHLGCFDLDVFLEINQRSRKWQCPICLKNYSLENIIIDPYFNRITSMMQKCSDDFTDVEIKPDGCWRVKTKNESERRAVGDLAHWHFLNGSHCDLAEEEDIERKVMVLTKSTSGQSIQANDDIPYDLILLEDSTPMDINASDRDGQDGNGTIHYNNSGFEYDSGALLKSHPSEKNKISFPEVIELSDSDDDELMIVTGTVHESCTSTSNIDFNLPISDIPSSISPDYPSKPAEVYDTNHTVYEVSDWGIPFGNEADYNTGLFDSSGPVSASCTHIQNTHMSSPSFTNVDTATGTSGAIAFSGTTPVSFNGVSPSLQTLLPPTPTNVSMDYDTRDKLKLNASVENHSDDWISLRLGDCQSDGNTNRAPTSIKDSDVGNQMLPEQTAVDLVDDDAAALLLQLSDGGGSDKISRQISEIPFSYPRKNRSIRRRTCLSIDSD